MALNMRVNKLLESSNNRMVDALHNQLHDVEGKLQESDQSKHEMAVTMHGLQEDLLRMRNALARVEARNTELERIAANATSNKNQMETSLQYITENKESLETRLQQEIAKWDQKQEEFKLLQQVCRDLKKALKARELSDGAAQQHTNFLELKAEQEKSRQEQLAKRLQEAENENRSLVSKLSAQEHETKLAQNHIDKIANELKILSASKAVVQSQWQASLQAMSKRDDILNESERKRIDAESKLANEVRNAGSSTQVINQLQARIQEMEVLLAKNEQQRMEQASQLGAQAKQLVTLTSHVEHARKRNETTSAIVEKQQAEAVQSEALAQRDLEDRKSLQSQIHQLEGKLAASESECQHLRDSRNYIAASSKRKEAKQETESSRVSSGLQNKLNRKQMEMADLEEQLKQTVRDLESRTQSQNQSEAKLNDLIQTNRDLNAENLRLQHRLNKMIDDHDSLSMKSCKNQSENSDDSPRVEKDNNSTWLTPDQLRVKNLQDKLRRAQNTIAHQNEEIIVLRKEWCQAADQALQAQQKNDKLKIPSERRDSELTLLRHSNAKGRDEITQISKQHHELAVQLDVARMQRRKSDAKSAKLLQQQTQIAAVATSAKFRHDALKADMETEVDSLRASLVASQKSNRNVLRQQLDAETRFTVQSYRNQSLAMTLGDTKAKLERLEEEVKTLQRKNVQLIRENRILKEDMRKLSLVHQSSERKNQVLTEKYGFRSKGHESASVSADDAARKLQLELCYAESELAEGQTTITKLQNQVEAERERAQRLGHAYMEREALAQHLATELDDKISKIAELQGARQRAIAIASCLETQLTHHTKFIDYEPSQGLQPSLQLQSSLEKTFQPQKPVHAK